MRESKLDPNDVPNPEDGADPHKALRLIFAAARCLDPSVSAEDLAKMGLGVSFPTLNDWCLHGKIPNAESRRNLREFISGIVDALPQAFERAEESRFTIRAKPFAPGQYRKAS